MSATPITRVNSSPTPSNGCRQTAFKIHDLRRRGKPRPVGSRWKNYHDVAGMPGEPLLRRGPDRFEGHSLHCKQKLAHRLGTALEPKVKEESTRVRMTL